MLPRLDVQIDEAGNIHPVDGTVTPPAGPATLVWRSAQNQLYQASEASLSEDWLRPEEDEAWAYLQQGK